MLPDLSLNRRDFLKLTIAGTVGAIMNFSVDELSANPTAPYIMTVNGPITPQNIGFTLPHEHIMVDFIGADKVNRNRYDPDDVFKIAMPFLIDAYNNGCRTIIECTPDFLGRDPLLMKRLSAESNLNILTNTGFYGAADDKFIPDFVYEMTEKQLADRCTSEWSNGIENTDIRPGFIKIGVDPDPSDIDMKLLKAAGLTHLRTGLSIASHTVTGNGAKKQIEALKSLGVHPSAFIWVHAHAEPNSAFHDWAAGQGSWLEFDGLSPESLDLHVRLAKRMIDKKLGHRIMISHDAGWYNVGDANGGKFRAFDTVFKEFIPKLRIENVIEHDIKQITQTNPAKAFSVKIRRMKNVRS